MAVRLNAIRTIIGEYRPPALPEGLYGPEVLADMIIAGRQYGRDQHSLDMLAPITDGGVRQLISLVYYASLLAEEGRFPRFKVLCQDMKGSISLVSRIKSVLLDSVEPLRRLAPACTNPGCALLIAERNGQLFCEGVGTIGGMGYGTVLGLPGVVGVGSNPSLRIEVFGPSHVRVGEMMAPSYEIQAGKVRQLVSYDLLKANAVRDATQERLTREVIPVIGEHFSGAIKNIQPLLLVLSIMLRRAADARHGGAFIFLPVGAAKGEDYGIKILYPTTNLDLGDDLVKQWHAFGDVAKSGTKEEYEQAIRTAERRRSKTMTDTEAVANFSAVDGCVVLTRDLRVLGFGAKIDVLSEQSEGSPRRFKHIASDTVYQDAEFMRAIGGTRHQSVARLSQVHQDLWAYTISQDGEVKLFHSDEKFSYAYGPLDLPTTDNETFIF
jgi:hypothetical protein